MKKYILLVLIIIATINVVNSQQSLKWTVGEPKIELIDDKAHITYPINVSIDTEEGTPILGTSTMRLFYDRNYLSNFEVSNVKNGYRKSGLNQSDAVFGEIFGFSNNEGVFAQFNIIDAARVNPIYLNLDDKHILDLSFDLTDQALSDWFRDGLISLPIVLDNNSVSWNLTHDLDCGYLVNDSGITGSYYLNGNTEKAILANDEVVNYAWETTPVFDGRVDQLNDRTGNSTTQLNLEDFSGTLSIKDRFNYGKDLFLVYRAPLDKGIVVNFSFQYNTDILIEVFDIKGALIQKRQILNYSKNNITEENINLSNVDNQVLLVKLTTEREVLSKKTIHN